MRSALALVAALLLAGAALTACDTYGTDDTPDREPRKPTTTKVVAPAA